jgi:hypothetical protein
MKNFRALTYAVLLTVVNLFSSASILNAECNVTGCRFDGSGCDVYDEDCTPCNEYEQTWLCGNHFISCFYGCCTCT